MSGPPARSRVADRVHRKLGRALRLANACKLGVRLDATALVEELAPSLDLDLVRAQVVGDLERKVARSDRRPNVGGAAGAKHQLGRQLVPAQPLLHELVEPQLLERHRLDAVDVAQPRHLERAHVHRARPVPLDVHERVRDCDGHLVAQLGRADRVAEDDYVGHGSGS